MKKTENQTTTEEQAIEENLDKKDFVENVVIERDKEIEAEQPEGEISERERIARKYQEKQEEKLGIVKDDPEPETEQETDNDEPDEVEVIINGDKRMVAKEKVEAAGGIENYQKTVAANEKLREVAEQRKQLEQQQKDFLLKQKMFQEQLKRQKNLPNQGDLKPNNQQSLPTQDEIKRLTKLYHEAMYEGEDNKASEYFEKLITLRAQPVATQPKIDVNKIALIASQISDQNNQQKSWENERKQANDTFAEKHPVVAGDEMLYSMASNKTIDIQRQNPNWSPSKVIDEAARQVEEWYTNVSANSKQQRITAKRNISAVKTAGGKAQARPEPKQETRSEYILRIQKERGQA